MTTIIRKKRILLFHANNFDVGGADYCLAKLAIALRDSCKFEPIVALRLDTPIRLIYESNGIPIHFVDVPRLQRRLEGKQFAKLPYYFARGAKELRALIEKQRIDLIHGNDLLDLHAPVAAKAAGIPSIQHVRMIPSSLVTRWTLAGFVTRLNSLVLCVSEAVRIRTLFQNKKAKVLYDWIDPAVGPMNDYANPRAELGLDENDRLVVCAGRLEPWKGQDLLLRAAPMILREQPLTHFAILGAPVHGKEKFCLQLEKLIRDFQLEGKVHLLGERRDVIGWMRSANVVVHCSRTPDPLPGVVLEAGLAGQAIVGAFDGGVPEEVPAENYDLLFKPGVVSELASRICQALQDPDLKMKGIMAQKFVQEKFSKERLFSQLESHYEFALGGSNG